MFGLGSQEIIIILVIGLVIFGAKNLPQMGEGLGKAIKNFKKATIEAENAIDVTPEQGDLVKEKQQSISLSSAD